jgi:V8-like Glu-specific endopeptidase
MKSTAALVFSFLLECSISHCQVNSKSFIKILEKSVVCLEADQQKYSEIQIDQYINNISKSDTTHKNSDRYYSNLRFDLLTQRTTISGSAIFVDDNGKKYLITAKHLLIDPQRTFDRKTRNSNRATLLNTTFNDSIVDYNVDGNFRVSIKTPYEVSLTGKFNNTAITNITSGNPFMVPLIFSKDSLDIAILSLQSSRCKDILRTLEENGYRPIPLSKVDTTKKNEVGDEVATIGYPRLSLIEHEANYQYRTIQSKDAVIPIATFGRISMSNRFLPYLFADLTVYGGNSGGPIIRDNKIIGIVSSQISVEVNTSMNNKDVIDIAGSLSVRGVLTKFINVSEIMPLLRILKEREKGEGFE